MDQSTVEMTGREKESVGKEDENTGLDLATFTQWVTECEEQPAWRTRADRECDYYDGNQLDSDVMRRAAERGLPPAIEPLIGPTIDSVLGMEAKSRTDWRVTPESDKSDDDIAEALNHKLNQAERGAKADAACSDAYASQIKVGLGWVEVAREQDPFAYPYRCASIHRNEIWYDWLAKPDMSNARFLIRRKWMDRKQAKLMHPDSAELIEYSGGGWSSFDPAMMGMDGGGSTDLGMSMAHERGWSIEEMQWRDIHHNRVCLFEVWYRDWQRVLVIKSPDGRVVEYDADNQRHVEIIASGMVEVSYAVIGKMRLAWFMGPHRLSDEPTPYKHNKFPYVPFWGKREDRTGVPYGLIRGMIYLQDEVNARIARMQWGLAAIRTTRTNGAVIDDDETFRDEVARPDADIVLDPDAMRQGGVFKVERDFELNRQQYDRLVDAREGIKRTGGIFNPFMGQEGQAQSGVAISGLVEQSNQALADINDNANDSRQAVGDLLISLIIEDMAGKEEEIFIDGKSLKEDRTIHINKPAVDEDGTEYLDNDISRTRLKVVLSDVPSSPSFRAQQLAVMSEAFKSAPPQYQKIMMPHLFALMDVPNKLDIIKAIKEMGDGEQSEEQIQQRIAQAVQEAMTKAQFELKGRELDQKQALIDAQVKKTTAEAINANIEGYFSGTETAKNIALQPAIAPMVEVLLGSAGAIDANQAPFVPTAPEGMQVEPSAINTNPLTPLNPDMPANPATGMEQGIEGGQ